MGRQSAKASSAICRLSSTAQKGRPRVLTAQVIRPALGIGTSAPSKTSMSPLRAIVSSRPASSRTGTEGLVQKVRRSVSFCSEVGPSRGRLTGCAGPVSSSRRRQGRFRSLAALSRSIVSEKGLQITLSLANGRTGDAAEEVRSVGPPV